MSTADTKDTPGANDGKKIDHVESKMSELDSKLAEITEQIKNQNQVFAEMVARSSAKPQAETEVTDDDVFEPKKLKDKILSEATRTAQEMLNEERRKNNMIYTLAQDYPEIQSDRELQKQILSAQKTLPKTLQDTPEGYEMAVLKAVSQKGLVAKSLRKDAEPDADVSVAPRSSARERGSQSRKKLSDATLEFARLMGRDVSDEKVVKALEEAANRPTFNRWS